MTPAQAFLANLQIASPCDASWADMTGDDRQRLCAQCDKHVYNVAHLTSAEVLALFEAKGPLPCLRLWRRADGTVLTADCPVGLRKVRSRRTRFAAALLVAILATVPTALRAQARTQGEPEAPKPHLMGKVACPPQPQTPTKRVKPPRKPKPANHPPAQPLMGAPAVQIMGEAVAPVPQGRPK